MTAAAVVAGMSGAAYAADPEPTPTAVFDARRALPMFPSMGYRDGFFLQHSAIGDFGVHFRAIGVYGREPLGNAVDNPDTVTVNNRFTLHAGAILSVAEWVELGLTMPFLLYQDSTGFNLNSSAIGDLRLLGKVNLHLPKNWPQLALAVGLGFETASNFSGIGAGGISGYPRLIIDMPRLLAKRLQIVANVGAVIAGITKPCVADSMTTPPAMPTTDPNCENRALGLGDHFIYGVGVSGLISEDQSLYVTTELLGSVSVGTSDPTRTPLFWDIGLRRARPNATFFTASYGIGLTTGSPSHTVLISLGLVWETKPPEKKKEGPTIKVEVNFTGLPAGMSANVGGKESKPPPAAGPASAPPPAGKPPGAEKPAHPPEEKAPPKPITGSAEIPVPEGLIPDEGKKSGGGDKKGKH